MAIRFDAEQLCDNIKAALVADLPAKLLAVEAEKVLLSKGVEGGLADVEAAAYYFQAWDNEILNHSPAIFYGIKSIEVLDSEGGATIEKYVVFVDLVLSDNLLGDKIQRILRYSRAIKEVLEAKYDRLGGGKNVLIQTVAPMAFQESADVSDEILVGGVEVHAMIV